MNILSEFTFVVNYDADNGLTTILDKFRKEIPEISEKTREFINLLNSDIDTQKWSSDGLVKFATECDIADESLMSFLKNTDYSEKSLANYQKHLQSITFGVTLKIVAANIAIVAATALVNKRYKNEMLGTLVK